MEKIIAIDVGLKRIGAAYTPNGSVVVPLPAIIRKNRNQAARDVSNLLKEYQADILVVGIPFTNEEMQRRIKHFVTLIDFDGKIEFQDESFTSAIVEEEIKGQIKHKKDGRIDSLAAKKILESYLAKK
ncbi:Holliday junction resolvase RuvX [Caminibacter pacificus]|jgi:putative Holliday junction resolvase|uniref:Putative pre-16S rRNA nuclease n=1 Tax=Caminibacter pacificus TaxID=1424653 RepID=A0AAJ4UXR0_9BACT|nr:Holliday junction resolvase RuvX [Caminibacter pacificus]QCI27947.1 Holliday junction resolvase RuvX [Caminibacter pacificus]ROR39874.1 putative Holliday junction resolvase [Caminibacter pacificus]